MDYYWNNGFYIVGINCNEVPEGAVPVTEEEHSALLDAQARGKEIVTGPDGRPESADRTPAVRDTGAFDAACQVFRSVCREIREVTGNPAFTGGFEELSSFSCSSYAEEEPVKTALLIARLTGANEYARYEGQKLGYGQPQWWHRCWEAAD